MAEPTLSEVFGANASQTASTITISKTDLATVGLNASGTNSPESLISAIVLLASRNLTEANRATDVDNRNVSVTYGGQDLVQQGTTNFRRDAFSVLLYKSTPLQTVNPNDY